MNKVDIRLILILIIVSSSLYFITNFINDNGDKEAIIYYKNEVVATLDLTNKEYRSLSVRGELGFVTIETEDGKVRVVDEVSPLHLCQKQGWVDSSYTPIVCLPNNVIIKIIEKENNVDAVVK